MVSSLRSLGQTVAFAWKPMELHNKGDSCLNYTLKAMDNTLKFSGRIITISCMGIVAAAACKALGGRAIQPVAPLLLKLSFCTGLMSSLHSFVSGHMCGRNQLTMRELVMRRHVQFTGVILSLAGIAKLFTSKVSILPTASLFGTALLIKAFYDRQITVARQL